MRYLLLVYTNEQQWAALSDAERDGVWEDCAAYGRELTASGHFCGGAPLQRSNTARTLRLQAGAMVETDGPFAETKEVLGGYHLVECKDIDEAVALGKRFPGLRVGCSIEVRPVMEDYAPPNAAEVWR
ncbi:MAG: YciI family protein [Verrucomicrobiota bacterium]